RELFLPNPTVEIKEFYWHCIKTTCNAFLYKVVKQLGKPRRNFCAYLPLRKSDERRFSQAVGRISQCLAAERR
ncbi:hypothetical protein MMJ10_02615, partial [Enterococcus cecorum]|nr:hypothetical protein [Enterococcus cecorum]